MDTDRDASAEPWITAEDAAAHLGYAVGTLYNKIAAGEDIPHRKLGRHLRFRRSELNAWVDAQGTEPVSTGAAS
jgi:excisionase family DNA binding protein